MELLRQMSSYNFLVVALSGVSVLSGCQSRSLESLRAQLEATIESSDAEVGVYYRDLDSGDSLVIDGDLRMHAASTMKVPIMIQAFRDADHGILDLSHRVEIRNEFQSIVDESTYFLSPEDDSYNSLYKMLGDSLSVEELIEPMIHSSSNLATNILVEIVGADRAQASMRELGADSIAVLRGVEDIKAYRAGLSNTTTARDLGAIFAALATGAAASDSSTATMLDILRQQYFGEGIPTGLPARSVVAHKTGSITEIRHDAGVVELDTGQSFVLVVLTRGLADGDEADRLIAEVARAIYEEMYR